MLTSHLQALFVLLESCVAFSWPDDFLLLLADHEGGGADDGRDHDREEDANVDDTPI
jgi:hypothetical protein